MAFDYNEARQDALALLTEYGQLCTLSYTVQGAYDNATLTRALTTVTVQVVVAELDFTGRTQAGTASDGTQTQRSVKQFLMAAVDATGAAVPLPQPGWSFTVVSGQWSVTVVKAVAPAGVNVMYDLECVSGG